MLTKEEYTKHDFSDCLRPEFIIPGLIMHMVHVANAANALSYHFHSVFESRINV